MSERDLRQRVLEILVQVAPDVEPDAVEPGVEFRDQFDFDSMDCLNFAIGLHKAYGIDIPEADYPSLSTLDGSVAYLRERGVV